MPSTARVLKPAIPITTLAPVGRKKRKGRRPSEPKPAKVPDRLALPFTSLDGLKRELAGKGGPAKAPPPVRTPPPAPRRSDDYEDRVALRHAMEGVRPLREAPERAHA